MTIIDPSRLARLESPLVFSSYHSWRQMLRDSSGVDINFLPCRVLVSLTTFLTSPLRSIETLRYEKAIQETVINPSPIFIVGHWRTGTTHLHNLLCQDKNLGYVTTFQAMAPGFCLIGDRWFHPIIGALARKIHPTRLIDNIPLSFDAPQEEEYAVGNQSPYSFIHMFTFPRQAKEYLSFFRNPWI
jgi:omega-hydroxy-beta-dihydromenaquinone-9 sulfotransferase